MSILHRLFHPVVIVSPRNRRKLREVILAADAAADSMAEMQFRPEHWQRLRAALKEVET